MNKKQLMVIWIVFISLALLPYISFSEEEKAFEITEGITTQQEVIDNFGEPSSIWNDKKGGEVWTYYNTTINSIEDTRESENGVIFMIAFDGNNIVRKTEMFSTANKHEDILDE